MFWNAGNKPSSHILNQYSYAHAKNFIPISIPIRIYHRSCSVMYMCSLNLDTALTQKVIGMPLTHLQSCLDQDVMMVTFIILVECKIFPELLF